MKIDVIQIRRERKWNLNISKYFNWLELIMSQTSSKYIVSHITVYTLYNKKYINETMSGNNRFTKENLKNVKLEMNRILQNTKQL